MGNEELPARENDRKHLTHYNSDPSDDKTLLFSSAVGWAYEEVGPQSGVRGEGIVSHGLSFPW